MLRSVTCAWRGIRNNFVRGHHNPFRTVSSDTVIVAVRPSWISTLSPLHNDTYLASENLPPLRRDWLANAGIILTVRAGSLNLCSSLEMLVAVMRCPFSSAKTLVDLCSIWMKGSPRMPAWDVHTISQAAEGIDPSSNSCLTCCSVSLSCGGFSVFFLCASDARMCGYCWNFVLSLSLWCWGRVKHTWRLPFLASGSWVVVTWRFPRCTSGSSFSTWLVSGV